MSDNEKLGHLSKWRQGGVSAAAYCRSENLKYSTFMRWVSVWGGEKLASGRFIELPNEVDDVSEIRILLPNGVSIITRQTLTAQLLQNLCDV